MIDTNANILLIYTGGTIGMVENNMTGTLEAFNFSHIRNHLPELNKFGFQINTIVFDPVIDSSDMNYKHWQRMVRIIQENYDLYDGFVILHGTDTMAYTASALSFMLENLSKPVVLTGAQLPIGKLRTDAKENLITALEIAADKREDGSPMVTEVCIFFQDFLLRGNRATKINADNFHAFHTYNYSYLATSGIKIKYDDAVLLKCERTLPVQFHHNMDTEIVILKLFPSVSKQVIETILNIDSVKAVVLETFGSGNAPRQEWFLEAINKAVANGRIIVNITQCEIGGVEMKMYQTGSELLRAGVISGLDMTAEAAVTKLMYLLGRGYSIDQVKAQISIPLAGEITVLDEKETC